MARKRRPPSLPQDTMDYLLEYETLPQEPTCKERWCRYCIITGVVILIVSVLTFIGIFVIIPLIIMLSRDVQTIIVFASWNTKGIHDYSNFRKFGIQGVRNFYIPPNGDQTIELGVWHVLPLANVYESVVNENYDYDEALRNTDYPVVLYFHGTGGNRVTNKNTYIVLRQFFHVIAFDYRNYGDSSDGELTEENVVQDGIRIYKWLRSQTDAEIYVWGYSLGTAISTHVLAKLRREGIIPMGLFLESPFTRLREEIDYFPITKIFVWLPWYEVTIPDPLEENGFIFNTVENILSVDCPILIIHAEDDDLVPYILGKKLAKLAREMRTEIQGNVTFYSFPAHFGFGHKKIHEAVELPDYIKTHISICEEYNKGKG